MNDDQTLDPIIKSNLLYSARSIDIATFLGSPVAGGLLVRKNFIEFGEPVKGRNALIISILFTIGIFVALFTLTGNIIDKIPRLSIPIVYTLLTHFLVNKYMGRDLSNHQTKSGLFYSHWRAAGISLLCVAAIVPLLFAYNYYSPEAFNADTYNAGIEEFGQNENQALTLFDILDENDIMIPINFIKNNGIPAWERNVIITRELDSLEGLDEEFIIQNQVLRDYCLYRIEEFEFIQKALLEDTNDYQIELDRLALEIERTLNKL